MDFSQVQTVVGTSFIGDIAETRIVSRGEALRVTEAKQTNGLYEAILLAVSFVFLLLGLLPSQPDQLPGARLPGEEHIKTPSP
jgi:hypothetical protein